MRELPQQAMSKSRKHPLKLADVAVFNQVAATLSFKRTAERLGQSRSAVSKRMGRLEADLGVQLFHRAPRSITLTPAGERFYSHTIMMEETVERASQVASEALDAPFGSLAFTMPTSLGALFTPLILREFQPAWPDLKLSINLDEHYHDIVGEGYDVAIRVARQLQDSHLTSRRLMSSPAVLVASPGYLKQHGRPVRADELRFHRFLTSSRDDPVWRLIGREGQVTAHLNRVTTFNNDLAMILAAVMDAGIMRTPRLLVDSEIDRGRLEVILSRYRSRYDYGVFAVYPSRKPPANVRVFVEFIEAWLPRLGELDRWDPLQLARE